LKSRVQSLERKRQEGFRLDGLHRVKPFGEGYPPQLARHRRGGDGFCAASRRSPPIYRIWDEDGFPLFSALFKATICRNNKNKEI